MFYKCISSASGRCESFFGGAAIRNNRAPLHTLTHTVNNFLGTVNTRLVIIIQEVCHSVYEIHQVSAHPTWSNRFRALAVTQGALFTTLYATGTHIHAHTYPCTRAQLKRLSGRTLRQRGCISTDKLTN